MTYWHMQLHPNNKSWNREKEVLTETGLIGCWGKQGKSDYKQFQYDMKMGDVVLIRIGKRPIALVEVLGDYEYTDQVNQDLDWFQCRRKVRILDWMKETRNDFPCAMGTLKKSASPITPTYHYIDEWYRRIATSDHDQKGFNKDQKGFNKDQKGLKIRHLFIGSYQIFHNFKIDLTNKEGEALPILVLAGINGSGKTTLLEYLNDFNTSPKFDGEDWICLSLKEKEVTIHKDSKKKQTYGIREYREGIVYLPINFENLGDLENQIRDYIDELMFERDFKASEAYEELEKKLFSPKCSRFI